MMPSKTQLMTVVFTIGTIWAINNIGALSMVKDQMNY